MTTGHISVITPRTADPNPNSNPNLLSLPEPTPLCPSLPPRCDLVFLPPSFPIVAMENPCLTFIIASILESSEFLLIDVVHEIAHGWFGNAVTNATWEEMWLSEGLATYAQRRITSRACGRGRRCCNLVWIMVLGHGQDADCDPGPRSRSGSWTWIMV